jgi:hypothetical protein
LATAAGDAVHGGDEIQQLAPAQVVVKNRLVRQVADPAFYLYPVGKAVQPVDARGAAAGLQDAHQHADGGGLTGAVRSEQGENLARTSRQAEPGHGLEITVVFRKAVNCEHGLIRVHAWMVAVLQRVGIDVKGPHLHDVA